MRIEFEHGLGMMAATLPDHTDVFVPGETVADPPFIPEDKLEQAYLESLHHPIGMPPLSELAFPGAKVCIIFPDRVKGGEQPTAHRKLSIPLILKELYAKGVRKEDILLICSNGLHRKNTYQEVLGVLGEELMNEFGYEKQIINHDSEDESNLVDLGTTASGDPVIMNRHVYEADIAVMIGHVAGNPYGGYSGGYKHSATGITHWRSIASHHVPRVMHGPDFTPVSGHSLMRSKFNEISMHMEEKMGKKFFCCDAVLDTRSRQIAIFSGYAKEMMPLSWEVADRRTYVHYAKKKYDMVVFGMPQFFHYGDGMGTNPIMLMQALSAQVIRFKRVLSDRCVFICSSACDGSFHEELWPYTRDMYDLFASGQMNTLPDMDALGERFATDPEYVRRYREEHAFHPFHGFSMISCAHIAEMNLAACYLVGASKPGIARAMGLKTRATFEEALDHAMKTIVGPHPNILALPRTFKLSAVHLCMAGEEGKDRHLEAHACH